MTSKPMQTDSSADTAPGSDDPAPHPGRASIVDHLLAGEPWPDNLVDMINDRSATMDRVIEF